MDKNLGITTEKKKMKKCLFCGLSAKPFIKDYIRCGKCGLIWNRLLSNKVNHNWEKEDFLGYFQMSKYYQKLFSNILSHIEKYKKDGNFLDIGCSVGTLLQIAKKKGFQVYGVESSRWAADYCRKKLKRTVYSGEFEKVRLSQNYYDVVVINHVLEHMVNPLKTLNKIRRILKEKGILLIGVPNIQSIMFTLLRENWPGLQSGMHVWQFNKKTLTKLSQKAGFKVIRVWSETGFTPGAHLLKRLKEIGLSFFDKIGKGEGLLLLAYKS